MTGEGERAALERRMVYCLVPYDLAPKLHEPLRRHFSDDPAVEVVVEERSRERRAGVERRTRARRVSALGERRLIKSAGGRRAGDRRAVLVAVEPVGPLPRKARPYAERLVFAERLEPASQEAEDVDTARLVVRFQSGEPELFAALYLRYFDRIYNYLRIVFKDEHEAEDGTQQVFMKVLESLPGYESRGRPFRAWIFTIARNYAISHFRKLHRVELEDPLELDRTREQAAEPHYGLAGLDWITDRELLLFVERLPQPQRQVLVLRYMLDLSPSEAAEVLGRTCTDVRKLQHRALRYLQARLTAVGRAPEAPRGPREHNGWRRRLGQAVVLRERRHALSR